MAHILFIHSAAMDVWVVSTFCYYEKCCYEHSCVSFCVDIFFPTFWVDRSGIVGSCDNSMFHFLRSFWTVFQTGCTILHCQQPCRRVPTSLHPHQPLSLSVFLILLILVGGKLHHFLNYPLPNT